MSCHVSAVGPLEWVATGSQSKWPLVLFISLAVGCVSSEGEGACVVDWFILNAMRAGGPGFTACSLCFTWGLSGRRA